MVLTETLTSSILIVFKRIVFFWNSFGRLSSEEIVGTDKLQENVVYRELENIKDNGVFDWFREREHAIGCLLTYTASEKASVHRRICSGDREDSRDSMKVASSVFR